MNGGVCPLMVLDLHQFVNRGLFHSGIIGLMSLPVPAPAAETCLSARLKHATRALHAQAERSGVMRELLRGRISWAAYLSMMRNLRAVYAALEAGLDQQGPGAFGHGLWRPELRRLAALDSDLAHWAARGRTGGPPSAGARALPAPCAAAEGGAWTPPLPEEPAPTEALVPATRAYAARLQALATQAPALLPAHAYVRYLGDLYGGQVLSRLVRQQFSLPEGPGTSFYEFGEASRVEQLRADFRSALDALPLTPPQAAAFIEEACEGFRLHGQMFEQIQAQGEAVRAAAPEGSRGLPAR